MVLVDVYSIHKPSTAQRIYAIIDEQSNTSLITSKLADDLGADGPREVYYLSTCSNERGEKSGRRVTGIEARSVSGAAFSLPTLVECDVIPGDKREIPTPEMARSFKHLKPIADQIPPPRRYGRSSPLDRSRRARTTESERVQKRPQRSPVGTATSPWMDHQRPDVPRLRERSRTHSEPPHPCVQP
ncbi:predicted protein [Nematostella vectensis]|uniref:Uncharacterized protein n=1 Tax=Nematostella vectensis TaxID=45351 RepID=A7T9Q7_NEMVE|nr:predicted protein [Nematostella vectensis]|eukprot:XP_001619366.1 hypothetical protein NEMVEDRAFT_v1g224255 [Nematostella vectensis]